MRREREGNSLPALEHSPPAVGSVNDVKTGRKSVTALKEAYEQSASWVKEMERKTEGEGNSPPKVSLRSGRSKLVSVTVVN